MNFVLSPSTETCEVTPGRILGVCLTTGEILPDYVTHVTAPPKNWKESLRV